MDETLKKILKHAAASAIRKLLVIVGTWLVAKELLTSEQGGLLADSSEIVLGMIIAGVPFLWGWYKVYRANKKLNVAIAAPPDLTRKEFEARFKDNDLPEPTK